MCILKGKDAEMFLKDFNETNRLMEEDPVYRAKVLAHLEECAKIYDHFNKRKITHEQLNQNCVFG